MVTGGVIQISFTRWIHHLPELKYILASKLVVNSSKIMFLCIKKKVNVWGFIYWIVLGSILNPYGSVRNNAKVISGWEALNIGQLLVVITGWFCPQRFPKVWNGLQIKLMQWHRNNSWFLTVTLRWILIYHDYEVKRWLHHCRARAFFTGIPSRSCFMAELCSWTSSEWNHRALKDQRQPRISSAAVQ